MLIDYFKTYLNIKAHLNQSKFCYTTDFVPFANSWKNMNKYQMNILENFKNEFILHDFKRFLVSNFIINKRYNLYQLKDKKCYNRFEKWKEYFGNVQYYFKQDIDKVNEYDNFEILYQLYGKDEIHYDTIIMLYYMYEMKNFDKKLKIPFDKYKNIIQINENKIQKLKQIIGVKKLT
jgi:hypothetical protein